jgi:hypothetical protein
MRLISWIHPRGSKSYTYNQTIKMCIQVDSYLLRHNLFFLSLHSVLLQGFCVANAAIGLYYYWVSTKGTVDHVI